MAESANADGDEEVVVEDDMDEVRNIALVNAEKDGSVRSGR